MPRYVRREIVYNFTFGIIFRLSPNLDLLTKTLWKVKWSWILRILKKKQLFSKKSHSLSIQNRIVLKTNYLRRVSVQFEDRTKPYFWSQPKQPKKYWFFAGERKKSSEWRLMILSLFLEEKLEGTTRLLSLLRLVKIIKVSNSIYFYLITTSPHLIITDDLRHEIWQKYIIRFYVKIIITLIVTMSPISVSFWLHTDLKTNELCKHFKMKIIEQ